MKKIFTPFIVFCLLISSKSNAQLTSALVNNIKISYEGNSKFHFTWDIAVNESVSIFDIEKSTNGVDFTSISEVIATEKKGVESYQSSRIIENTDKIMFRIKTTNKTQRISYSKIFLVQSKTVISNTIKILGNPVKDKLSFSCRSAFIGKTEVKVFNMTGTIVLTQIIDVEKNNVININLDETLKPGLYILEINNGLSNQTAKFIKQ